MTKITLTRLALACLACISHTAHAQGVATDTQLAPVTINGTASKTAEQLREQNLFNPEDARIALAALAAVFSVVSGVVMWWQRRPRGKVAAPTLPARTLKAVPLWLWPLMAARGWAMPVFGWSLLVMLGLETLGRLLKRGAVA